ncbi:hypothetical protein LCGC14_3030540 [marine sediment metagenome]|uniref:Uncharacterized protein n=1 Tax=marine sediment metagenome TaxID=412755 RepID=A0A0F8XFR2_9ZZZZ
MLFTPPAELLEFQLALYRLLILMRTVVDAAASVTFHLY